MRDMMKLKPLAGRVWVAVLVALGSASAQAADGTWIRPAGISQLWLANTNWSGGVFPGETNNAASLNTDIATITNVVPSPEIQIDFSAAGANGQLALGAIILDRISSATTAKVRPVVNGGNLTLNGASVSGIPNTILGSRGTGNNDEFLIGDASASAKFATLCLGSLTNVIQMGERKRISVAAVISERHPGSGIVLTSDSGEPLITPGGFSGGMPNTFTGPVRIEKGAKWDTGGGLVSSSGGPPALGLSTSDAANLILDNGVLTGRGGIEIDRLFTLGPGGGRLEAAPGVTSTALFAFTNTGAIGFEGVGPRTLTLARDDPTAIVTRFGLFVPSIGDAPGGGKTSLVRTNTCIWTLTGANTYSGPTISAADGGITLKGNGSFANSPTIIILAGGGLNVAGVTGGANHDGVRFALASGQTLTGNGSVSGAMSVRGGATVAPGLGVGNMTTSYLIFTAPNAVLAEEIDLGVVASADLLQVVNGGLDLGGATLSISLLNAPAAPTSVQTFLLIQNSGSSVITNQFGSVNLSGPNASGYQATVDYAFTGTDSLGRVGNGNDLAITLAPATVPTSFSLSISATNGIATLTWPSVSNQTYWVQYKSALTNASWDDLPGEVVAAGTSASKTDTIGTETRFYRVRIQ